MSIRATRRQTRSFTLASELIEPDCVYCLGVSAAEVHACSARIQRHPRPWTKGNFGPVEWLGRSQIGDDAEGNRHAAQVVRARRQVPCRSHPYWHAAGRLMDDEKPLTLRRALIAPEFWLFVVTAIAGTAGLSPWIVIPLAVAGLSISSIPKYIALWPRARAAGADHVWWSTLMMSMFNNLAASCAAFLGIALRNWQPLISTDRC